MKEVSADLISMGQEKGPNGKRRDANRAEVRVLTTKIFGTKHPQTKTMSVTRHVVRQGPNWVGNNPDGRAQSLNDSAEARFNSATTRANSLLQTMDRLSKEVEERGSNPELAEKIFMTSTNLVIASDELASAQKYLDQIHGDFPRLVVFRVNENPVRW